MESGKAQEIRERVRDYLAFLVLNHDARGGPDKLRSLADQLTDQGVSSPLLIELLVGLDVNHFNEQQLASRLAKELDIQPRDILDVETAAKVVCGRYCSLLLQSARPQDAWRWIDEWVWSATLYGGEGRDVLYDLRDQLGFEWIHNAEYELHCWLSENDPTFDDYGVGQIKPGKRRIYSDWLLDAFGLRKDTPDPVPWIQEKANEVINKLPERVLCPA